MYWKDCNRNSRNMNKKRFATSLIVETGNRLIEANSYFSIKAGYLKMFQVTFSLSNEYRANQLTLIRRYNTQFRELVTGAQPAALASSKPTKLVNVAQSYHKVRENAMILYNVLKEKLLSTTCSCQVGMLQIMRIKDSF